ncbi:hypothetical protein, partial [Xanthomonas axonopodis]
RLREKYRKHVIVSYCWPSHVDNAHHSYAPLVVRICCPVSNAFLHDRNTEVSALREGLNNDA